MRIIVTHNNPIASILNTPIRWSQMCKFPTKTMVFWGVFRMGDVIREIYSPIIMGIIYGPIIMVNHSHHNW